MNKNKCSKGYSLVSSQRKIDRLVKEEEIKWTLFEKCKDELLLDKSDLEDLKNIREKAWNETKKKYAL